MRPLLPPGLHLRFLGYWQSRGKGGSGPGCQWSHGQSGSFYSPALKLPTPLRVKSKTLNFSYKTPAYFCSSLTIFLCSCSGLLSVPMLLLCRVQPQGLCCSLRVSPSPSFPSSFNSSFVKVDITYYFFRDALPEPSLTAEDIRWPLTLVIVYHTFPVAPVPVYNYTFVWLPDECLLFHWTVSSMRVILASV